MEFFSNARVGNNQDVTITKKSSPWVRYFLLVVSPLVFSGFLGGTLQMAWTKGGVASFLWCMMTVIFSAVCVFVVHYDEKRKQERRQEIELKTRHTREMAKEIEDVAMKEMEVRHVLVGIRNILETRAQLLDKALDSFSHPRRNINAIELLDFPEVMQRVVTSVFNIFSRGNVNLDHRFQVTFMERNGDLLTIKYFENTDHEIPETMNKGRGFREGEGLAGQAWLEHQTMTEPDTENPRFFIVETERQRFFAKSAVSIPVYHRRASASEKEQLDFFGVLNIDASIKNFFQDTNECRDEIRIRTRPYVQLIVLLYKIRQLCHLAEHNP